MTDQRLYSSGNIRLRVYPANGFANFHWPTVAELNAGLELEDAVAWDNFGIGVQSSDTSSTPPLSAKASVDVRSQANYGGGLPVWYPGYYDDPSNQLSLLYDLLDTPRTDLFIAISVDGEIGESGQPASSMAFANGDLVTVMKVATDAWEDTSGTTGDDPFYYIVNLLKKGGLASYTVASTTAPVLAVTGSTTGATGSVGVYKATVNGRDYTRGVKWSSTDAAKMTASPNGVARYVAAGSASMTATLPKTTAPTTGNVAVTIS